MTDKQFDKARIREQIERTTATLYSTEFIEERIAADLLARGVFEDAINNGELEIILRNVVYTLFSRQKVAGFDVGIVHNVVEMSVNIEHGEAHVDFIVHIHKPVIVFLELSYTLINDLEGPDARLRVKDGTLQIAEKTRRFDIKAKAALTAMNVPRIVRHELADLSEVIRSTLPDQLRKQNIQGELNKIGLSLNSSTLSVYLQGEFAPLT